VILGIPDVFENNGSIKKVIFKNIFTVLLSVIAALAAFYSTVASLKISLASKVESSELAAVEKRLNTVESAIDRNFISRDDFYRFREEMNYRLLKIEFQLQNLLEGEVDGSKK
jgi:hypothetical protein